MSQNDLGSQGKYYNYKYDYYKKHIFWRCESVFHTSITKLHSKETPDLFAYKKKLGNIIRYSDIKLINSRTLKKLKLKNDWIVVKNLLLILFIVTFGVTGCTLRQPRPVNFEAHREPMSNASETNVCLYRYDPVYYCERSANRRNNSPRPTTTAIGMAASIVVLAVGGLIFTVDGSWFKWKSYGIN